MNKTAIQSSANILSKLGNLTTSRLGKEKILEITIGTIPSLGKKAVKTKHNAKSVSKVSKAKSLKTGKAGLKQTKLTAKAKSLPEKISKQALIALKKEIEITKVQPLVKAKSVRVTKKQLTDEVVESMVLRYRQKARKLARSILRKWHSRLDIEEVDSVVDLSLCEAVKRYDASKGASFMTFLFYHLRGNLIRTVATAANSAIVPILDHENTNQNEYQQSSWMNRGVVKGVSANEIADALTGGDREQPDHHLLKKELALLSRSACGKLDDLEREVIRRIYEQEEQLLDIAQTLGYSRCHISRVKRRALESLFDELKGPLDVDKNFRPAFEDEETQQTRKYKVKRARRRRDLTDFLPCAEAI